ncbi:MAG TPA: c-type cytochrome [Chitinophagaceae bacterium]|jgi:cytochrome c|nr:c-type cytochrome [Chitinophagaceae bacterium]
MIRKFLFAVVVAAACTACGNDSKDASNNTQPEVTTNTTDNTTQQPDSSTTQAMNAGTQISAADADKGLELIGKSDCLTCHKVEERLIGPSYREVATKYAATDETITMLSEKIIQGGAGNWGQVAMTPHPQLSKEDAQLMAKYVMSLKQ